MKKVWSFFDLFNPGDDMKIGIIGTHSTGKTTLAKAVAQALDIPFVRVDTTRDINQSITPDKRLDELTDDEQYLLQRRFFDASLKTMATKGSWVTDCCPITLLPYADHLISDISKFPLIAKMQKRSHGLMSVFDLIIYLPPETDLVVDGFRPISPNLRISIDTAILRELYGYSYFTVTGTLQQRIFMVTKLAGNTKNSHWNNFISFEGLPGCGKSTQIKIISDQLRQRGVPVHICERYTPEAIKRDISKLYIEPEKNQERLLELHIAAFMEQFEKNQVLKRICNDELVISDRQRHTVFSLHMSLNIPISELYRAMQSLPAPGRVVYMKADIATAIKRNISRENMNPLKTSQMVQKMISNIYDNLALHDPSVITIDANRPIALVTQRITSALDLNYGLVAPMNDAVRVSKQYVSQGTKPWKSNDCLMDLFFQIGSLTKLVMQQNNKVHHHGLSHDEITEGIALDIGDILSLALQLANTFGFNPDDLFTQQMKDDVAKINSRVKP